MKTRNLAALVFAGAMLLGSPVLAQQKCPSDSTLSVLQASLDDIQSRAQRYVDFVSLVDRPIADRAFGTAAVASLMISGSSTEEMAWTLAVFLELSGDEDATGVTPLFVDFAAKHANHLVEATRDLIDYDATGLMLPDGPSLERLRTALVRLDEQNPIATPAQPVRFLQTTDVRVHLTGLSPVTEGKTLTVGPGDDSVQYVPPGLYEIRYQSEVTGQCARDRHVVSRTPDRATTEFLLWPDRTGYQSYFLGGAGLGRTLTWQPCP